MTDATRTAEQLVRDYRELWNEQDYARIPDVVSERYRGVFPESEQVIRGREGLEEYMRGFTAAFPDFHVDVRDILAREETVVAESTYTMTHEGEFDGVPPTGREVELDAMAKFRIEDGAVVEHREYHDRHAFLEQLGLTDG